ncbi:MAG: PorT family protein [Bacteroidetes bacterium]|nr:PorT family protein [Bacteroidota bacterium]
MPPLKTLLWLLLLLPLLFRYGNAQDFSGGLTGGLSTSQVSGDELAGFNKAGIFFGGFTSRSFSEKWSAMMQLSFIMKGSKKPTRVDKGDYEFYRLSLWYIDIPVLIHYKAYFKEYKAFSGEAGFSFGTLVFSEEEDQSGNLPGRPPFKRFDLSLAGGIHYHISDNLNIYMRMLNSILPIRGNLSYAYQRITGGQYNTALLFGAEYFF